MNKIETKPEVSILISYYKEKQIQFTQSIKSILKQTFTNFELIIVQDGGRELETPSDHRIKIIRNEKNEGLGSSLNKAFKICKGKYIVRHDADDICMPNRVQIQLDFLKNNPSIDILGTSAYIISENNEIRGVWNESILHKDLCSKLWREIPLKHPTWMFKKDWFMNNTNKYKNLKRGQDQYFLITNYKKSFYHQLSTPLIFYRVRKLPINLKIMGKYAVIKANFYNRDLIKVFFSITHVLFLVLESLFFMKKNEFTVDIDKYFSKSINKKKNLIKLLHFMTN